MPDLSPLAVHEFWSKYQDPTIYQVISFMEAVEGWSIDHANDPNLEAALKRLGVALDNIGNIDLQQEEKVLDIISHLKTGRGLRLLMSLDTAYPGAASKVLMKAEQLTKSEKDLYGFFLKRNVVFERLRLLSRIFSKERLNLILNALEKG